MDSAGQQDNYSLSFIARLDLSQFEADLEQVQALINKIAETSSETKIAPRVDFSSINELQAVLHTINEQTVTISTSAETTGINQVAAELKDLASMQTNVSISAPQVAELMAQVAELKAQIDALKADPISVAIDPVAFEVFDQAVAIAGSTFEDFKSLTGIGITPTINEEPIVQAIASLEVLSEAAAEPIVIKVDDKQLRTTEDFILILKNALSELTDSEHILEFNGQSTSEVRLQIEEIRVAIGELQAIAGEGISLTVGQGATAEIASTVQALAEVASTPVVINVEAEQIRKAELTVIALKNILDQLTGRVYLMQLHGEDITHITAEIHEVQAALHGLTDTPVAIHIPSGPIDAATASSEALKVSVEGVASAFKEVGAASALAMKEVEESEKEVIGIVNNLAKDKKIATTNRNSAEELSELRLFNADLQETELELGRMKNIGKDGFDEMGNAIKKIPPALQESTSSLEKFGNKVVSIGQSLLVFFAIQKVIELGTAIFDIIPKIDGVGTAFRSMGGSEEVLKKLREQSRGLVSDLDIERLFNKFSDFNIPVKQLGVILGEVSRQAQSLGLNIEQQVDKAVQALGTNGNRALASLGISTKEFAAELDKGKTRAEALADILSKNADQVGPKLVTIGDQLRTLKVDFENLLAASGNFFERVLADSNSVTNAGVRNNAEILNKQFGQVKDKTLAELEAQGKIFDEKIKELAAKSEKAQAEAKTPVPGVLTSALGVVGTVINKELAIAPALKANEELMAAIEYQKAIKYQIELLGGKKNLLDTITALEAQQAETLKQAESLSITKPNYKEEEAALRKLYDEQGAHINDLNGTTAQKAKDAEAREKKKLDAELQRDYNKALQSEVEIRQKLKDSLKSISDAPNSIVEAQILAARADADEQIRQINLNDDAARKAGKRISTKKEDINTVEVKYEQESYSLTYDAQKAAALKNTKESDKLQNEAFAAQMELRRKLYQDELSFETKFGISSSQEQYGYSTTALVEYLDFLKSKTSELTVKISLTKDVNNKANLEELQRTQKEFDQVMQTSADALANYAAGLVAAAQTAAEKVLTIQEKLKRDLAILNSPQFKASDETKAATAKDLEAQAKFDERHVESAQMSRARSDAGEAAVILNTLGSAYSSIGEGMEKSGKSFAGFYKILGGALTEAGGLAAAFASGGPIGLALKGISDLASAVASVFTSQAKAAADLLAYQQKSIQLAVEYGITLQNIADKQALSDQNHLASLKAGLDLLNAQNTTNKDSLQSLYDQLRKGVIVTGLETKQNFFGKSYNRDVEVSASGYTNDELDKAASLGQLNASQLVIWQKINALKQQNLSLTDQAVRQQLAYNNALVGQTADGLGSALLAGLNNAAGATSIITDALRKSVLAGLDASYIKPIADKLFAEIALDSDANFKTTGNSTLSADQIKDLTAKYAATLKDAYTNVNTLVNSLTGPAPGTSTNNLSSAIQGITAPQADLLAGQFGGLRLTAIAQLAIQTSMLTELQKISGSPVTTVATKGLISTISDITASTPDAASQTGVMSKQLTALLAIQVNTEATANATAPLNASLQLIYRDMVKSGQANQQLAQTVRATGRIISR